MKYEQLWAPWRLGYIQGDKEALLTNAAQLNYLPGADPECFLCQCAGDAANRERHVVHWGPHTITLLNRYPYNNGHLLIAPKRHVGRLDQLTTEEQVESVQRMTCMVTLLERILKANGFNIGLNLGEAAGAGLPGHLHWHIVPRWNGDSNFMPAIAGAKVIPQSLDALWEILTEELGPG